MNIVDVEGIGPVYAEKLTAAGIGTVEALLTAGAQKKDRAAIAERTGISEKLILEWVNHADLMRVKGVGAEYSDLLEAAGVDSVPELAQRNAANLTKALEAANEAKHLVRSLPAESQVAEWIEQAKKLERAVHH